jgi:hypothetical protein
MPDCPLGRKVVCLSQPLKSPDKNLRRIMPKWRTGAADTFVVDDMSAQFNRVESTLVKVESFSVRRLAVSWLPIDLHYLLSLVFRYGGASLNIRRKSSLIKLLKRKIAHCSIASKRSVYKNSDR